MNLRNTKERLFQGLFPQKQRELHYFQGEAMARKAANSRLMQEKEDLRREIRELRAAVPPKPTMSDMMNEILGSHMIDVAGTELDGYPKDFMDTGDDDAKRKMYAAQLHQIHSLEAWKAMCAYYIDWYGNYIAKQASDVTDMTVARMTMNGIKILRSRVENGNQEYLDQVKPPEDFDKFSTELLTEN